MSQISSSLHLLQLLRLLLPGVPQELAMLKDSSADDCIFEGKGWGGGGGGGSAAGTCSGSAGSVGSSLGT